MSQIWRLRPSANPRVPQCPGATLRPVPAKMNNFRYTGFTFAGELELYSSRNAANVLPLKLGRSSDLSTAEGATGADRPPSHVGSSSAGVGCVP